MQATNPFEESTDSIDSESHHSSTNNTNDESFMTSIDASLTPQNPAVTAATSESETSIHSNTIADLSQISISPSLFPPTLSSWMGGEHNKDGYSPIIADITDDEGTFHDCISEEAEGFDFSDRSFSNHASLDQTDSIGDVNATAAHHNMSNVAVRDEEAKESTSLLLQPKKTNSNHNHHPSRRQSYNNADETPLRANSKHRHSYDESHDETPLMANSQHIHSYNTSAVTPKSPLQDALSTWLSPYAQSARKAGRRLLSFEEKDNGSTIDDSLTNNVNASNIDEERADLPTQHAKMPDLGQDELDTDSSTFLSNRIEDKPTVVRFQPEMTKKPPKRSSSLFNRVASSPALMTTQSYDSTDHSYPISELERVQFNHDTVVLKEIETNQNHDEDGSVMHPWTKLILLEELGTASSWTIILLPYAFMILALFLDGNSQLKNTTVGPLSGRSHCVDVAGGRIAEPFGVSAKGYFPVPFSYNSTRNNDTYWNNETESCTYPFELREGVGLLSHGIDGSNSSTFSTSIVDAKYRYLMSHGYAFTSGVIPDVPATSQSLIGKAEFSNLSSRAVALVADGGVVASSIIFQRKPIDENCTNASEPDDECHSLSNHDDHAWSPVLILSPRRLDLRCTLNEQSKDHNLRLNTTQTVESSAWNCVSNLVEAFFSLPNAALLVGGDLRVDTLISHHKQHRSLSDDFWFNEMNNELGYQSDNVFNRWSDDVYSAKTDQIWKADLSKPTELLAELSEKSSLTLTHQSESYNVIVEVTRIFALIITFSFLCYWSWMMGYSREDTKDEPGLNNLAHNSRYGTVKTYAHQALKSVADSWKKGDEDQSYFWWESPWATFPDRRYLLLMLFCLLLLQNPLLAYAFFNPSIYSSATFRSIADSISGMSVHGMLFLWLCLMHGLRYHTADVSRRRFEQYRRVIELQKATEHMSPPPELQQNKWGKVKWYYKQYGDVEGGGADISSALRHKHDINADSFIEFLIPKMLLLVIGVVSTVTAANCRFPESQIGRMNHTSAAFLNPDRFGGRGQLYVFSSIVQIIVIQLWGVVIIMTSFVTGERLRREPFLSTRPAQLTFRVLTSILLLGFVISITLFSMYTSSVFGNDQTDSLSIDDQNFVFDTSAEGGSESSWDSKADILFRFIRRVSADVPYVDTSFNIGPGKLLYATACSLVAAYIFLPSSHFRPSEKMIANEDAELHNISYTKEDILWVRDKMLQGTDKRFVVTLARYTHTWRVFPLPIRSHGLMSQHTIKETLNLIGTFQLDGGFGVYRFKNGRGSIFKGRYIPVFCVEIACWLLEASWQAYYSPTEYVLNDWAPGMMCLNCIGLRLERAIIDEETDTHAYVATNASSQVEGEEDSIIVVSFRGTASYSNMKTDLSFRQVPLPAKLSANVPSFDVRPGKDVEIEDSAWDVKTSPRSILKNILHPSSFPTAPSSGTLNSKNGDIVASNLLPAVTDAGKAIIRATPMARQALPCVHEGFLCNYLKVRKEIIETILHVLKRQVDKAVERSRFSENSCLFLDPEPITLPKIYVTGHSLGGSLAQLLALDLASNCEIVIEQVLSPKFANDHLRERASSIDLDQEEFWLGTDNVSHRKNPSNLIRLRPPIAVYTFGQPRVGNLAFKTIYKQRVPHTFRVVTEGDAFTSMPTLTCFGGIYRHAGLEVLLDEGCTGNILVGPTVVETLLRFTKVRTSVANHSLAKYRDSLESALEKDDLKEYYKSHSGKVKHDEDNLPSWVTNARREG